jgi:hypothetical protein
MKRIFTSAMLCIIFNATLFSQQPENPGFEFWENVGLNVPEPVNWSSIKTSDNSTLNGLAPYVWDQSTDAHSGNYSVKLYCAPASFGIIAAGVITNGRIHSDINPGNAYAYTDVNDPQWHTPFTHHPDSVVVWAKYTSVGGDVAQVKALLHTGFAKIPDVNQTNWIAMAEIDISSSVADWTRFSAPFNYFNNNTPEYILFVLNSAGTDAHEGSVAYFDDLELIYNEPELDLTVFLQGPYAGSFQMSTDLNPGYIPLAQPYNTSPWNYFGTESITATPNNQVVDWILVELRDAASAASATAATTVSRKAGFLLSDGTVVATDGSTRLTAPVFIDQNLFVVIRHRNHLDIMSSAPLVKSNGVYTCNFSQIGAIYGTSNGYIQLEPGIPGLIAMAGGDGNADGTVNSSDKNSFWSFFVGSRGYLSGDYTLSGHINNPDKNEVWLDNLGKSSEVPD